MEVSQQLVGSFEIKIQIISLYMMAERLNDLWSQTCGKTHGEYARTHACLKAIGRILKDHTMVQWGPKHLCSQ